MKRFNRDIVTLLMPCRGPERRIQGKTTGSCSITVPLAIIMALYTQIPTTQTTGAQTPSVTNYGEAEITLSDQIPLSDIAALPIAPGSDVQVLNGGRRVRAQLPTDSLEALADNGAQVAVLKNFMLVESPSEQSGRTDNETAPLGTCSGYYFDGENDSDWYILTPWPDYYYTAIDFGLVPETYTVSCIDVHYEVRDLASESRVDVELSDDDYFASNYVLEDDWASGGDIVGTTQGITAFNGKLISQVWRLWATDMYPDGDGYIDYWWLKLYFEGEPPPYCIASGGCYEHISGVVVGTINNTGTGCSAGYEDYTDISTEMEYLTGYPITVTCGDPYEDEDKCGFWVDWNQDLDFNDPGETIEMAGSPGAGPYTATIMPPSDAEPGETRMRVRIRWGGINGNEPLEPCGHTAYGEVEDYTITVTGEQPSLGDLVLPLGIDFKDYAVLAGQWKQPPAVPSADIAPPGGDNIVNELDLRIQVQNWLGGK